MEVFVCLEDKNVIKVPSLVTADIRSVMLLLLLALLSLPAPAPALTITAPGLRVERAEGGLVLDTALPGLIVSDQFLQLPLRLPPGSALYGWGENEQDTLQHDLAWRTWGLYRSTGCILLIICSDQAAQVVAM